ncbi:TetR family dihydroxyacetone kinase regulator [Enterococcus casseliflavus]|uniref:TetR/AcrR family transcriptional regulator n=1 Tax=Enterococcus casseliflavus TaxID=37734 RepID=UPI000E084F58|nr:TetR/AcrR family transcriptional regulator [Enterococcus casseliflavus]GEB30379.1 TetR family transcriptional regulator [Enterococcus casseliflavus]STP33363.1 TetR family dihydroxyacetone kinase regulator [Enterococcus casseliflavus]
MTTVDRRVLKSQKAIKSAFIELMAEKGFDKITVKDICKLANVGNRTFYLHFQDKYDLLDNLIEGHMLELKKLCDPLNVSSFKEAHLVWFRYLEKHYLFFSTMLAGQSAISFRKHFLELIKDEIKKAGYNTKNKNQILDEEIYLNFFASAILGVVESYLNKEISNSLDYISEQLAGILKRII